MDSCGEYNLKNAPTLTSSYADTTYPIPTYQVHVNQDDIHVDLTTVPRSRAKGYTREEWVAVKDIFSTIYLQPDFTLDDAMNVMAQQYDFHATRPMYKKRIAEWGIAKNLSAKVKDRLSHEAQSLLAGNQELPAHDQNGKTVPWDRVRRRDRALKQRKELWDRMSKQVTQSTSSRRRHGIAAATPETLPVRGRVQNINDPSPNTRIACSPRRPEEVYNVDYLLFYAREMCCWNATRNDSVSFATTNAAARCISRFSYGFDLLHGGDQKKAIKMLNEAGVLFNKIISQSPLELLVDLVWDIDRLWQPRTTKLGRLVSSFMHTSVIENFGASHPVAMVYQAVLRSVKFRAWEMVFYSCILGFSASSRDLYNILGIRAKFFHGILPDVYRIENATQANIEFFSYREELAPELLHGLRLRVIPPDGSECTPVERGVCQAVYPSHYFHVELCPSLSYGGTGKLQKSGRQNMWHSMVSGAREAAHD